MNNLRSPLAKTKNLGASHDASNAFWIQRITALALAALVIWFCFSVALLPEVSYPVLINWLQTPFNAVMMILIVIIAFLHAQLGMQVIFEDYISRQDARIAAIIAVKFISYFLMAYGVFSIITIVLKGH